MKVNQITHCPSICKAVNPIIYQGTEALHYSVKKILVAFKIEGLPVGIQS